MTLNLEKRRTQTMLEIKMKRQRKLKEHGKNSQDQINEEKTGKLSEKQSRVMIVKMFQNSENRMEKMQKTINTLKQGLRRNKE